MKINNYEINFKFNKFKFLSFETDHANKYADNTHTLGFQFMWFKVEYTKYNYNKIVHLILDEDEKLYSPQQMPLVNVLYNILRILILKQNALFDYEGDYIPLNLSPFCFNYIVKDNGKCIYYVTAKKEFFDKHNLGVFLQHTFPDCYMQPEEINYYFMSYNEWHTYKQIRPIGYNEKYKE